MQATFSLSVHFSLVLQSNSAGNIFTLSTLQSSLALQQCRTDNTLSLNLTVHLLFQSHPTVNSLTLTVHLTLSFPHCSQLFHFHRTIPSFPPSLTILQAVIHPFPFIHKSSTLYPQVIHPLPTSHSAFPLYPPLITHHSSTLYPPLIHHPPFTHHSSTLYPPLIHPLPTTHPPVTHHSSTLYLSLIHI